MNKNNENPIPLDGASHSTDSPCGVRVNDIHSKLNPTCLRKIEQVRSLEHLQDTVSSAAHRRESVCIAASRGAMGGQQFAEGTTLIDMSQLNRVLSFNPERGILEVEAGITWPEIMDYLLHVQEESFPQWGIRQKQTGADRLSLGGAVGANVHGRGLKMKPFIDDVEELVVVDAGGAIVPCSRAL